MKTLLLTIYSVLLTVTLFAQFAPSGSVWHYTEIYSTSGDIGFLVAKQVGDTTILTKLCQIIEAESSCLPSGEQYVYQTGDSVFLYCELADKFQLLYDFGSAVGESWKIDLESIWAGDEDTITVSVDSTYVKTINNQSLRTLNVIYTSQNANPYQSQIIEHIGDLRYLFNFSSSLTACDENHPQGLRCYQDPAFGLYETGIADSCTQKITGLAELNQPEFRVYPNPTSDIIHIQSPQSLNQIELLSFSGQLLWSQNKLSPNNLNQIDISSFPTGMYFLKLTANQTTSVVPVIKTLDR